MESPSPSKTDWKEWAKTLILLCLGVYGAFLLLSGNLAHYINMRFAWLTGIAVLLFLLLGGMSLYVLLKGKPPATYTPNSDYDHTGLNWTSLFFAAIPLFLAILIPSRPLGVEAVSGGVSLNPVGVGSAEAFTQDPLTRNILDWLRVFNDAPTPAALNGEQVDVVGFVYREPGYGETQFMVARFSISCCVADAFAIGIPVDISQISEQIADLDLRDGTWIRVQGALQAGQFDGNQVPIIQPTQIEAVDEPPSPYLYS